MSFHKVSYATDSIKGTKRTELINKFVSQGYTQKQAEAKVNSIIDEANKQDSLQRGKEVTFGIVNSIHEDAERAEQAEQEAELKYNTYKMGCEYYKQEIDKIHSQMASNPNTDAGLKNKLSYFEGLLSETETDMKISGEQWVANSRIASNRAMYAAAADNIVQNSIFG